MSEIVDMCRRQKETEVVFSLNYDKWRDFDDEIKLLVDSEWRTVKFLDEKGDLHEELKEIPADKGGIYIFILTNITQLGIGGGAFRFTIADPYKICPIIVRFNPRRIVTKILF